MIITVTTHAGGTGKSTTCVNLAYELTVLGHNVLVVDIDSNAGATRLAAVPFNNEKLVEVIEFGGDLAPETSPHGFDIIPSSLATRDLNIRMIRDDFEQGRLSAALENHGYDYVLIDTPGESGYLTLDALSASDGLIVPVIPNRRGAEALFSLCEDMTQRGSTVIGCIPQQVNLQTNIHQQYLEAMHANLPGIVSSTCVPYSIQVQYAENECQPVSINDPKSIGARAFAKIAHNLAQRQDCFAE